VQQNPTLDGQKVVPWSSSTSPSLQVCCSKPKNLVEPDGPGRVLFLEKRCRGFMICSFHCLMPLHAAQMSIAVYTRYHAVCVACVPHFLPLRVIVGTVEPGQIQRHRHSGTAAEYHVLRRVVSQYRTLRRGVATRCCPSRGLCAHLSTSVHHGGGLVACVHWND
jgi:hypothetical protein